ncbi:MAG: prepilin-type N-terminal cleavage/methylation domain-containing protein [Raoultibacter sp.]
MNEMIKKVRGDKKGFTLAELLIVVAIILVLVAIAIPVFTGAMDSANKAVAQADIRAVKSQAAVTYLMKDGKTPTGDLFYKGDVDKDGNITNVVPATGATTATTTDEVVTWLKGDKAKVCTITVKLETTDLTPTPKP